MQGSVDGISGDHLLLAPPAVITPDQIAWSVEQLAAVDPRSEIVAPPSSAAVSRALVPREEYANSATSSD